ncbi:MAG: peptide-N-glycosidase F-related protein, partial [Bacteroidota bacterium]
MLKFIITTLLILTIFQLSLFAQNQQGDTTTVQVFTFADPSPEGWTAPYKGKVKFPDSNKSWEKILLVKTLKCDSLTKGDKYPCGEWDYITETVLYVPQGDTVEPFQIISFITPYGKRLKLGGEKGWIWYFDITDYAPILKGEMDIKTGNNQELLDLKFLFIKGTPPRNSISVKNLYPPGKYKYEFLADDSLLKSQKVILSKDAEGFMLKARISGHGHEGPHNCCEWDNKTHTYHIGEWEQFRWNVWKDCGFNPIYPQGGTWQFDRAGWCPGTAVDEYNFELTPIVFPGDTVTIDYSIEMYRDNGEKDGNFRMSHQLFSYGSPNFNNDASIVDIVAPSSKDEYRRLNPVCANPRIIIQNGGKNNLRTLKIIYGLEDGEKSIYEWTGDLKFLEKEEVWLTTPDWGNLSGGEKFVVEVSEPNGIDDEYKNNNSLSSTILQPLVLPSEFIIHIETNNIGRAKENSYTITNDRGAVVKAECNFQDSTIYDHSVKLEGGCYEFRFIDKMEDGMIRHWWNRNSDPAKVGINGKISILDKTGEKELHKLNYDFAQEIILNFRVEE